MVDRLKVSSPSAPLLCCPLYLFIYLKLAGAQAFAIGTCKPHAPQVPSFSFLSPCFSGSRPPTPRKYLKDNLAYFLPPSHISLTSCFLSWKIAFQRIYVILFTQTCEEFQSLPVGVFRKVQVKWANKAKACSRRSHPLKTSFLFSSFFFLSPLENISEYLAVKEFKQ